jgi:pimeloyl-ACP methyl ester carboxylesterase
MLKNNIENTRLVPFQIQISQETLDDLKNRLEKTVWIDKVENAGWDYGTNLEYMKELKDYWQNKYDWRKQETELNKFNHFKADVNGLNIHFIYEHGKGPNPQPIILTHGWPDSFYRYHKIIPMLTNPEKYGGNPEDSFDVIVPSIPGYGFSSHPHEPGMTSIQIAKLWGILMKDILGYPSFVAGGGDLGSDISINTALLNPDSVKGIHLTDTGFHLLNAWQPDLTKNEREYVGSAQQWFMQEGGYGLIQSTKPQTLSYGLNDSPIGLAAWIIEKYRTWSDCDGNIENRFTKDEILTNIMIYWVTKTIGSSVRLYYENNNNKPLLKPGQHIETPAGLALFKDLVGPVPREYAERHLRIKQWTEMSKGGHYGAWEEPELFADDIRNFNKKLNK